MTETAESSIAFLIGDIARAFRHRFEAALAEEGLEVTAGEARTLHHAAKRGPVRQNLLAESMSIEPMTLVNFLDRLEERGWVVREPDPTDRRAKIVRVTSAAKPLVEQLERIAARIRAAASAGLSKREMETLRTTLTRLADNLSGRRGAEAA
jgi:DNA-binding MarR family transcriptional regulator